MKQITLKPIAQKFFEQLGFKELTHIQKLTYQLTSQGKDLIVQSATGSGKTHAFLFPLIDKIDTSLNQTQALIIAPTRELAQQIYYFSTEMKEVLPGLTISLVIGGKDKTTSVIDSHIVIGTPGRLADEFTSGMLLAQNAKSIVIDEADMIWEYGFMDELVTVVNKVNEPRQMLVYSATVPEALISYFKKAMHQAEHIINKEKSEYNPKINHFLLQDLKNEPHQRILDIFSTSQISGCIVFCNTRQEAAEIAEKLREYGVELLELHGDLTPRKRKQTLNRLIADQHFVLVATDIAARGLDLPFVSHVISVGLPSHLDFYFHRAGRTGRAGKEGTCYVLVNKSDKESVLKLKSMGIDFQYKKITNKQVKDAPNFFEKRTYHKKMDPEVLQILNRKSKKVKPNYKKKRKEEIAKLQRKKRREKIQAEIKKQKKERAKARSKNR